MKISENQNQELLNQGSYRDGSFLQLREKNLAKISISSWSNGSLVLPPIVTM